MNYKESSTQQQLPNTGGSRGISRVAGGAWRIHLVRDKKCATGIRSLQLLNSIINNNKIVSFGFIFFSLPLTDLS